MPPIDTAPDYAVNLEPREIPSETFRTTLRDVMSGQVVGKMGEPKLVGIIIDRKDVKGRRAAHPIVKTGEKGASLNLGVDELYAIGSVGAYPAGQMSSAYSGEAHPLEITWGPDQTEHYGVVNDLSYSLYLAEDNKIGGIAFLVPKDSSTPLTYLYEEFRMLPAIEQNMVLALLKAGVGPKK